MAIDATKHREILAFYRSQETRLRTQLRQLESNLATEATAINQALLGSPQIRSALRMHGVPDQIIDKCKFTASKAGVVIQFPRAGKGQKAQATAVPPFSKATLDERHAAGVFKLVDEMIGVQDQKILDNQQWSPPPSVYG